MSTARDDGAFAARLGRAYGLYAIGLVAFVFAMALLGVIGVPGIVIGHMVVGFTLLACAVIGVMGRTMRVGVYFAAGRRVPALYNGMATGAGALSGACFIGLSGALYLIGGDALAFVLGWSGGLVLAAILIAPYLRRVGAYTVPDFLAARYGGALARLAGVVVLLSCSFAFLVAQFQAMGVVAARFLGLDFAVAVHAGLAAVLACTLFGGMRALTWTQAAQYVVVAVACLVPAAWIWAAMPDTVTPHLAQAQAFAPSATPPGEAWGVASGHVAPLLSAGGFGRLDYVLLVFCLALGTASLPHVLMRGLTARSASGARSWLAWSLLLLAVLALAASAYAAFARWTMLELAQGGLTADTIAERAGWLLRWGQADGAPVWICGRPAIDAAAVAAACGAAGVERIGIADIALDPDMVMLAAPEMAGLPSVMSGLLAAGCLAALLACAGGLLMAVANALGHDVYHRIVDPNAPPGRRLVMARVLLVLTAAAAASLASTRPADLAVMASWAFSIAASGLFPALVLGIWWKRTNAPGALAGIAAGFGVCVYYLVATRYGAVGFVEMWGWLSSAGPGEMARFAELKAAYATAPGEAKDAARAALDGHARTIANWGGVKSFSAAAFGAPAGFAVTVVVSLMTRAPAKRMRDFVDAIRVPRGGTPVDETAT